MNSLFGFNSWDAKWKLTDQVYVLLVWVKSISFWVIEKNKLKKNRWLYYNICLYKNKISLYLFDISFLYFEIIIEFEC